MVLQLCSMTLMAGLFILLRSATKITHKAQSVTCLAAKWHICATLDSFDGTDGETPTTQIGSGAQLFLVHTNGESENDDASDEDDDLDNTKMMVPAYAHTISFQKRQALGEFTSKLANAIEHFKLITSVAYPLFMALVARYF